MKCHSCQREATWWAFSAAGPVIRSCSHHRARLRAKMSPHSEMFPITKVTLTEAGLQIEFPPGTSFWQKTKDIWKKQGSETPSDARSQRG
jgi:hypothetical protein